MNCPNCGQDGSHFVPPSLGEPGYFYCDPKNPTALERRISKLENEVADLRIQVTRMFRPLG